MSFTMKFSEITSGQLLQTLHKMGNANINPRETHKIKKIAKMMKEVMKHSTEISTRFTNDVLPLYAKKREDGTYIDRESGQGKPFDILEGKEGEYKVALEKFNEQTVTIESDKLNWKDIAHANVKPVEVLHLEQLFNEESLDEMLESEGPGVPTNVAVGQPQPTTPLRSV